MALCQRALELCNPTGREAAVKIRVRDVVHLDIIAKRLLRLGSMGMVGAYVDIADNERIFTPNVLALVGAWARLTERRTELSDKSWFIAPCPEDPRGLTERIRRLRPSWLIFGGGLGDRRLMRLAAVAQLASPRVKLAVLGDSEDLERCDLWLARGAAAYFRASIEPEQALDVMSFAEHTGLDVIDGWFRTVRMARRALLQLEVLGESSRLTRREFEVLRLVRAGMRNSAIAQSLNIGQSTVEFHVSNILAKLGARSRTEAVQCANSLGLT